MVNKAIIIGNLGSDPEIRYTQAGKAVTTLSVATSRSWKDQSGQKKEETEWHRVNVWDKTAEFCGEYLRKGMKVYCEGRIQTRKWQDQDGNDRYTTEIVAQTVQNLSPKQEQQSQQPTQQQQPQTQPQQQEMYPSDEYAGTGEDSTVPF